jgi:hypothetical protein
VCKQPTDKHCNLDQGKIKIKSKFQAQGRPLGSSNSWQLNEHAQFEQEYVNPTYVGQAN